MSEIIKASEQRRRHKRNEKRDTPTVFRYCIAQRTTLLFR